PRPRPEGSRLVWLLVASCWSWVHTRSCWQLATSNDQLRLLLTFRRNRARMPRIPDLHQPLELPDRLGIVVHLQPQHDIVVEPHAAVLFHDHDRGGLLPALVAAARLAAFERGH